MNMCNPSENDFIWILEADEFATTDMLKKLKSRYILGHQILSLQDIRWIVVPQMEFIYKEGFFKYSWSGRFFKYKKGSHFTRCNKFNWGNTLIYNDKWRWDLPPQYGFIYHMKFIKSINRLKQRYGIKNHKDKMNWFDNDYMKYYNCPEESIDSNLFKNEPIFRLGKPYPSEISKFLV